MRNTKQKASIQSMNNDNLNLQANNEGKSNTPGCRCINYNELYGNSITIENEMQHVGLNRKFKLCPSCLLTGLSSSCKERIYHHHHQYSITEKCSGQMCLVSDSP